MTMRTQTKFVVLMAAIVAIVFYDLSRNSFELLFEGTVGELGLINILKSIYSNDLVYTLLLVLFVVVSSSFIVYFCLDFIKQLVLRMRTCGQERAREISRSPQQPEKNGAQETEVKTPERA